MSKIGMKPIPLINSKVEIKGNEIFINGPKAKFVHKLPTTLEAVIKDGFLTVSLKKGAGKKQNAVWGLHRALLANEIMGSQKEFEKSIKIVGLGYKAQQTGKKLNFYLGYSHKIELDLPENVDVVIDKTGQSLTFKSCSKQAVGDICDKIRYLKPPEPYKGTGVLVEGEQLIRKAGKTKAA